MDATPPLVPEPDPAEDAHTIGRKGARMGWIKVIARCKRQKDKVSITQWVDPVVRKQIAQIALDEDKDQYELVNEALNLLFEKYGRSPIA
jgi:hypothetical protein